VVPAEADVNREEGLRALATLAASPAARWIGNKLEGGMWFLKCLRCGSEASLKMPSNVRSPADVPMGFDEKLYVWKRDFQGAHESCAEVSS
jgi:hypothetical protein